MPSTLVHLALGGIVAVALLGDDLDSRSLAVVLAFTAIPDVDTFVGVVLPGAHRSLLHTLVLPVLLTALLWFDTRRSHSSLLGRFGTRGYRVIGVGIIALVFGGIGPDLVTNGVNWLYPLRDQFLALNGDALVSNQRGFVQTFVELGQPDAGGAVKGNTQTLHYSTGVDPSPGTEPDDVERIFPLVDSGMELLLVVLSSFLVTARLTEAKR